MKKISLITLHYIDNYGSVLQTLASQKVMEKYNTTVEVVNIIRNNYTHEALLKSALEGYKKRLGKISNPILMKIVRHKWENQYNKTHIIFENFRNKYINLSNLYNDSEELKQNPPIADFYCSGSDQVWNTEYNGKILDEYFLSFAPKGSIKFSLASGFGKVTFGADEKIQIKELLEDYNFISVRESSAKEIIDQMGIKDTVHVLDPTLLLDKNEWLNLLEIKPFIKNKYVLMYQLNNNPKMVKFAQKLARKNGCKLIAITNSFSNKFKKMKIYEYPLVEEFLSLFNNAEYIVTDSFHGTAFSLNFNKQFFVFYPPKFSTRLESILKLTNTKDRLIENDSYELEDFKEINYDNVNDILDDERKKALNFLKKIL